MHAKGDLRLFRSQNQGASWTQVDDFTNASNPTLALPVLAADSAGRLALEFTQSDSTDTTAQPVFAANVFDPTDADPDPGPDPANWVFETPTAFYNPSPANNVRAIGDYSGIGVADPILSGTCTNTSTFLPAWTDTLNPSASFMVDAALMSVTP